MLGAITGDIIGSLWEFRRIKTKVFPLFLEDSGFTDDTVLTCAVADSLLNGQEVLFTLREWPRKIPISHKVGGYGKRFMEWVAKPNPQPPYQSFGNGSAMRVSPCAWHADSIEEVRSLAIQVTDVTHDHPEGIKGAVATAEAIWFARHGQSPEWIRGHVQETHGYDMQRSVDEIRLTYRYSEACQDSVPESILCALEATSFEDAVRNAVSLGGDADTMACIAGAIAEARFGIPEEIVLNVRQRLHPEILGLVDQFYGTLSNRRALSE
jgi:ADP-ribosyl-[dinitrogen reductase] hydrolase